MDILKHGIGSFSSLYVNIETFNSCLLYFCSVFLAHVHASLLSILKAFMSDGKFISVMSAYLYKFVLVVHTHFLFLWCQVPDQFPVGIIDGSPVSQNSTGAHQTTMAFHMSLSHPVAWNHLLHTDWTIAALKGNLTFLIQFNDLNSLVVLLICILVILKTKPWIMFGKQYLLHSLSSEVCCQIINPSICLIFKQTNKSWQTLLF